MGVRTIGSGSISTTIPNGAAGPELHGGAVATPQVSGDAATAPIPSNDWWSSLVYNYFDSPMSAPLYADPITLRADGAGLQIGYQSAVRYIDGPGLQVEDNIKYEYAFAPGLHVGLEGLSGAGVTVSDYGDWTVTADWQQAGGSLQATFGHGLPFVYFSRSGDGAAVIDVMAAPPVSRVDNPTQPLVYELGGLNGAFDGGTTHFRLPVDSGTQPANGPQVRLSYDFDGDGRHDRVETYSYHPTDAAAGWETYTEGAGMSSQSGAMADFTGGSVKLEIWNAIGDGAPAVRVDAPVGDPAQATVTLPFDNLRTAAGATAGALYLRDGATAGAPSALSPVAGSVATVDILSDGRDGLSWNGLGEIWYSADGMAGVTIRGVHYGIFAPPGAQWAVTETGLKSDLAGADSFAAAVLPEKSVAALQLFAAHADDRVTGSTIDFAYDPATDSVTQTFSVTTQTGEDPLSALYRHQWINTDEPLTGHSYQSARGEMKLARDSDFTVTYDASPMLPVLPLLDATATAQVRALLQADVAELASRPIKIPFQDTYTAGKELGRLAELAQIANQIGESAARDAYLAVMKSELEDWFTAGSGTDKMFAYNAEWGTLQGYPASFDTEKQLNDHNFHYGYFVQAAATIAMFDPEWASSDRWGAMVDLLVADVANADRGNDQFPWLRSLDPYAGHSWASGHGAFQAGNNNESSSEALNFSAALSLWGAVTGRSDARDLGMAMHTVESAAVLQYWFDVDRAVFPDEFPHEAVGMVWGDGASHTTWFSDNPEMIHGINLMPVSASTSLHLATHQDEILANYADMAAESGGAPRYWKNIHWEYLALADPERALTAAQADPSYSLNEGGSGSRAQTLHWISSLAALGTLNDEVRADSPFHAVFTKNGINTYVAYNPGAEELVVRFTDGRSLAVEPNTMATLRDGTITSFDIGGDRGAGPDPDPGPGPDPDPGPDPGPDPHPEPAGSGLRVAGGAIGFDAALGTIALASAAGANHDGRPHAASTFSLTNVTADFAAGQTTGFALKVDAGTGVADAVQFAVSYDFDGDGSFDRTETYSYFATDNVAGWETYGSQAGLKSATGAAMQDLVGGTVKVDLWNALGNHRVQVDLADSSLSLPFQVAGGGTGPGPDPDPDPGPDPLPEPDPDPPPGDLAGDGLILVGGSIRFDPEPATATLAAANGANHDGMPLAGQRFTLEGVTADHLDSQTTGFRLLVDAGPRVGDAVQAAVSYDFDGNGTVDRTETYRYFATDDVAGWQVYGSDWGLKSVAGTALQDLVDGTVVVDLWSAIGSHPIAVDLAGSSLDLPFRFGADAPAPTPPAPPGPGSPPDGTHFAVSAGPAGLQLSTTGQTVIASAGDGRYLDQPHDAAVFKAEGLHGQYNGGSVAFALPLDAGSGVGNGTQLRLAFDFDGNGTTDRTETWQYLATDNVSGWETYSQAAGSTGASGAYADFAGGSVTAEIWNAIGSSPVTLDEEATVILPYSGWLI